MRVIAQMYPIGPVLKALRLHLGMSQREFADKLGWSEQRVGFLEGGKFQPTLPTLFRIAEVTGYPASKIIKTVERYKK